MPGRASEEELEAPRERLHQALAQEMERVFMADVARAREIERAAWAKRGWRQRVVETLARRFEFFL